MTLAQAWCGFWRGHDAVPVFEARRMFLRCASCQHDSPGVWTDGKPPRLTQPGHPARQEMQRVALVARKSA